MSVVTADRLAIAADDLGRVTNVRCAAGANLTPDAAAIVIPPVCKKDRHAGEYSQYHICDGRLEQITARWD